MIKLKFWFLISTLLLTIVSCDKDYDIDYDTALLGKWQITGFTSQINDDDVVDIYATWPAEEKDNIFELTENKIINFYSETNADPLVIGTYNVQGSILIVVTKSDDEDEPSDEYLRFSVIKLTDDKLVIKLSSEFIAEDGSTSTTVQIRSFKRVS